MGGKAVSSTTAIARLIEALDALTADDLAGELERMADHEVLLRAIHRVKRKAEESARRVAEAVAELDAEDRLLDKKRRGGEV